jgi:hypothetical protein
LRIDVTIPPNTTATVVIPVDSGAELRLNGSDVSETPGVVMLDQNERNIVLQVIPGSYSFVTAKTGAH